MLKPRRSLVVTNERKKTTFLCMNMNSSNVLRFKLAELHSAKHMRKLPTEIGNKCWTPVATLRFGGFFPAAMSSEQRLFQAIESGSVQSVCAVLSSGVDVDAEDAQGFTPLNASAFRGRHNIVRALLAVRPQINKPNVNKATPLYSAAFNGHVEVVKTLLQAGEHPVHPAEPPCDIRAGNVDGCSPLYAAALNGHVEVVRALLDHAHRAAAQEAAAADPPRQRPPERYVDQANNKGQTPLYAASSKAFMPVVCALLEAGADVDKASRDGWTPLHVATEADHAAVVRTLVARGANANAPDKYDNTPFHVAARGNNFLFLLLLAKAGADASLKTVRIRSSSCRCHCRVHSLIVALLQMSNQSASSLSSNHDVKTIIKVLWSALLVSTVFHRLPAHTHKHTPCFDPRSPGSGSADCSHRPWRRLVGPPGQGADVRRGRQRSTEVQRLPNWKED